MAIGDNNNNYGKILDPTYYSRLILKNSESKRLSIQYRSGLMNINIEKAVSGEDSFKTETEESIFLSPMKAQLLVSQIDEFIKYIKEGNTDVNKGFGVNAGMGEKVTYIAFSVNAEGAPAITIGKFDGKGIITESSQFNMSKDYNYALNWENLSSNEVVKVYDNFAEITMLRNAIADFARNISGAAGYATLDLNRYENNKANKRMDQVFDKLGIERVNYGNKNYQSTTNNFLNNTTTKTTTYEDIEDLLIN